MDEEFKGYVFKVMEGCDLRALSSKSPLILNSIIAKKGEGDLPRLIDTKKPRMKGPKRASKIRKLSNLFEEDGVQKYVDTYCCTFATKSGKKCIKALEIQRLVTPLALQRKRAKIANKQKRIVKA